MPRILPSVLTPLDLPLPELLAARIDGQLYRVGDGFAPVDEVEQPRHRAHALHPGPHDKLIAERMSAAWVWGATVRPPRPLQFCVATSSRVSHPSERWLVVREVVIDEQEIAMLDGVAVTTPLRTVVDLLRTGGDTAVVAEVIRLGGLSVEECRADITARRNLPHKLAALARLDAVVSRS